MFILTDRQYGEGFEVNEYKGQISLIAAREANNGKIYQRWGEIETGKDQTKRLPVSVKLGSKEDAIKTLQAVINCIKGGLYDGAPDYHTPDPPDNGEDVPF